MTLDTFTYQSPNTKYLQYTDLKLSLEHKVSLLLPVPYNPEVKITFEIKMIGSIHLMDKLAKTLKTCNIVAHSVNFGKFNVITLK